MLNDLLAALQDQGGSDLHLRVGSPPRLRVDGELRTLADAPVLTGADTDGIVREIMLPRLAERFARGEEIDFAYSLPDGEGRFRVNAYLQKDTVGLVFRRIVTTPPTIDQLQLPEVVRRFADEPRGLVLVAGPTGSGKTTTLAAMVDHINRTRPAHIVTIEDPIEVMHRDVVGSISQRELGTDTPSFASAMRAALRQDPDVILVGEMRDAQTVSTAIMAAETGHLVLSTLHTTDAAETVNRIIEFFPPDEQRQVRLVLAGVLKGTLCQRLVPLADGTGRLPATEVLVVNGRVQTWITDAADRQDVQEIIADGEYYGMHTYDQSILAMYAGGRIDLRAALAASSNPHDLTVAMRAAGLDTGEGSGSAAAMIPEGAGGVLQTVVEQLSPGALPTSLPLAPVPATNGTPAPAAPRRRRRTTKVVDLQPPTNGRIS